MQQKIHSAPTLVYPSSDGKPMAETDKHRKLMMDFIQMLEYHFRDANDVYGSGNLLMYYEEGNPGGQDLWRWTLGEFLNDHGDFLHIQSDVFGGNSGGPVLNKQGILLGIIARSDRHMNALAIPARDINRLLSESRLEHSRSHR